MKRVALIVVLIGVIVLQFLMKHEPVVAPAPPAFPEKCLYAEYPDLKSYQSTKGPKRAWVEITGGVVRIWVECKELQNGSA